MQDYLIHFGILGQKHGVRRFQYEDGSLTPEGRERYYGKSNNENKERIAERKEDIKNVRSMSMDEINNKIERLKKETELRKLTEEDINPGKAKIMNILEGAGTKVLSSAAVGALAYAGKYYMTKEFDAKEAASYMFSNPNKKK